MNEESKRGTKDEDAEVVGGGGWWSRRGWCRATVRLGYGECWTLGVVSVSGPRSPRALLRDTTQGQPNPWLIRVLA